MKECGVEKYHFYYPYPDYKFPTTIFSDKHLPKKGELSNNLRNYDMDRMLLFDEELMTFAMGNCITLEDTNGNRKLLKKRYDQKIDAVAAMMDGYVAYKLNKDAFE